MTNITTRNIEEIYDKDILRLQNFQNLAETDIGKIKLDLTGALEAGGMAGRGLDVASSSVMDEMRQSLEVFEEELRKIKANSRNSLNVNKRVRDDVNVVFGDIDDLKKDKQKNALEIEKLKRTIYKLENEQVADNEMKIVGVERQIGELAEEFGKTAETINKQSQASIDEEKVALIASELHNMKSQLYFLQQSIVMMRTQVLSPSSLSSL